MVEKLAAAREAASSQAIAMVCVAPPARAFIIMIILDIPLPKAGPASQSLQNFSLLSLSLFPFRY